MENAKHWNITVSITRTLEYPIEENENKDDFLKWAKTIDGKNLIQAHFVKNLRTANYPSNAEMDIVEVEVK